MIYEKLDKSTGAILFKQDEDGQNIERIDKTITSLIKRIDKLEKEVKSLKSK